MNAVAMLVVNIVLIGTMANPDLPKNWYQNGCMTFWQDSGVEAFYNADDTADLSQIYAFLDSLTKPRSNLPNPMDEMPNYSLGGCSEPTMGYVNMNSKNYNRFLSRKVGTVILLKVLDYDWAFDNLVENDELRLEYINMSNEYQPEILHLLRECVSSDDSYEMLPFLERDNRVLFRYLSLNYFEEYKKSRFYVSYHPFYYPCHSEYSALVKCLPDILAKTS